MRLTIRLTGEELCWLLPLSRPQLNIALQAMACAVLETDAELDLHLVRDAEMASLNHTHMGCTGPTNVLSFPADHEQTDFFDLGSLVLCLDMLRRESLLYGQEEKEHCLRLLAHGMGHLLGYDHGPDMDGLCERMELCAAAALV